MPVLEPFAPRVMGASTEHGIEMRNEIGRIFLAALRHQNSFDASTKGTVNVEYDFLFLIPSVGRMGPNLSENDWDSLGLWASFLLGARLMGGKRLFLTLPVSKDRCRSLV